jgi:hypothetical protein
VVDNKSLILGLDFGDQDIQICCFNSKTFEPESISLCAGNNPYIFPAVIGLKPGGKEWVFGEEALELQEKGMCQAAGNLYKIAKQGTETVFYDKAYTAAYLLEKLFRKCLTCVTLKFPGEGISKLNVTVKELNDSVRAVLQEAFANLGLKEDRLSLQSHSLSYEYYALNQKKELWSNDIGLFHMDEEEFQYKQISISRKFTPIPVCVSRKDFNDVLSYAEVLKGDKERLEYCFLNLAKSILHKQLVTTIYVTGCGFEGDWADNALKELCVGRRVFKGQNLYAKGACYAAKEKKNIEEGKSGEFLFLDSDQITSSISLEAIKGETSCQIPLWDGYKPWFDGGLTREFILTEDNKLTILVKDLFTLKKEYHEITLDGLEVRLDKTTRIEISVSFKDSKTALVHIRDKGFGQMIPSLGLSWESEIKL